MIFVGRVTVGQEKVVVEMIKKRVKKEGLKVSAVLVPPTWKGYFLIEADAYETARAAVFGLRHARGILPKPVSYEEISQVFAGKVEKEVKVEKGALAMVLAGPLKGEKVKVMRVEEKKGSAVVVPVEMPVPIPVTVKLSELKPVEEG